MPNLKQQSRLKRLVNVFNPSSFKGSMALFVLVFAMTAAGYFLYKSFALTSPPAGITTLYIEPSTGTKTGTFLVPIYVHTAGTTINTVEARIWYPTDKLQYLGTDNTGSIFTIVPGNFNTYHGAYSRLVIDRGTLGSCTLACLVTKVKFKVLPGASGQAAINFGTDSLVLTKATPPVNVLKMTQSGIFTVSP